MRSSFSFAASLVALAALAAVTPARADRLQPGSASRGVISEIGKGVKELSLETQIVFRSQTDKGQNGPDTTSRSLALVGAPVFRYFLVDNLNLALHAGGFYRSASTKTGDLESKASEAGFLGTVTASYYLSLGGGMFLAPLVGGGFFAGSREAESPGPAGALVSRASVSGGVARAGLGLVFYSSPRFNLFARPEALIYFGSAKPKADQLPAGAPEPPTQKFTTIDGGFTCGLSYVF